ncbi:MAG: hypothetical protein K2J95_02265 [Lachnospiraceae bacterium]|nr:hypothetical protein [Lachnospiraceae bacterium]
MDCGMVREFSEEKRQEIFRMLDEIDNREWKSFMEWCGNSAEEFGDWTDKLAVSAYTRYVDEYHKKVLETNEMTRNRVNTVFENVAEIDTRYAGRMRECQEKIKEQIAMVKTMTEFMQSMTDGIPNMALITKESVSESGDSLKVKNKNKLVAEINYANTATEEDLNVISIDVDCYEIRNSLSLATYGIEDCMGTINELYENGFISEEDYRSICILAQKGINNSNSARHKIEGYFDYVVTTVYIYNCLQELAGRTITPEECCKVNEIFRYCNITDRNSIACLLICCAGESYGLTETLEDFVSGHGYEYEERGAGYIQVTFKDIQRACLQYIYDMYGIEETITDQEGYAKEVAEYPWAASAWFWAILLKVGKYDPQTLNSYVMERLEENGGKLTLGIVLTAECFVHGDVNPDIRVGGYTLDDALHVIARYDSLRLNDEKDNGGWYVEQYENNNEGYRLHISAETIEYFKNNENNEISASDIPSEWDTSKYLEFTAPYNWNTFAGNYNKLYEADLLDFDLKP